MKESIVLMGVGEIGGVFARGLLRLGHPVFPVTRSTDLQQCARELPAPRLVLVTVGEKDLHPLLDQIPEPWRARIGLVQNELLPRDWQRHGLSDPTIISVWFEKKSGQDAKIVVPSPVFGPQDALLVDALAAIQLPAWQVGSDEELLFELVRKNLYILTTNIAGLAVGGDVGTLWAEHRDFAQQVAREILVLQEKLTGVVLDHERLITAMVTAFEGDLLHGCMGRSAPARLARALEIAAAENVSVPLLQEISQEVSA